jgi:hypothetical protein
VFSPQGKKKSRAEISAQGIQHTQAELEIIMPKILERVKENDEMVGGVNTMKYSDHDVAYIIKFPDLMQHNYMESKGEGPSGMPLLEPK